MMTLSTFLFLSIGLFAVAGLLRGGAKEFLATVSIFLALFVILLVEKYVPMVSKLPPTELFFVRAGLLGIITFFGYQTPQWRAPRREMGRLTNALLGAVVGALNGYLVIGMLWHYLDAAKYPWPKLISSPTDSLTLQVLHYLPNAALGPPVLYIVVALFFVVVIVVFV